MKKRLKKSYFAVPVSVLEQFRRREISAYCVTVFAYLCSLRNAAPNPLGDYLGEKRDCNGVQISQKFIAMRCGITAKTAAKCIDKLLETGLVERVFHFFTP